MSTEQPSANPYRKVSVATWSDRKVSNLTPLQPSGQALFLMLMVGPQSTNIPGVQPIGRLAFAEQLQWEPEAFDEAFQEVLREGLAKADWKARLVFVPKAIKHNLPQSPNVVKSWGAMWARVPECDLKAEAWHVILQALEGLGEAFAKAFKSACPLDFLPAALAPAVAVASCAEASEKASGKASPKPSPKTMPNQEAVNRKQEVEEKDAIASSSASPPAGPPDPDQSAEQAGGQQDPTPADAGAALGGDGDSDESGNSDGDAAGAGVAPCPLDRLIDAYAAELPTLPQPRRSLFRQGKGAVAMRQRWRWVMTAHHEQGARAGQRLATSTDEGVEWFRRFFRYAGESDFLTGRNQRWTGCDLAWLMQASKFERVLTGAYHQPEVEHA